MPNTDTITLDQDLTGADQIALNSDLAREADRAEVMRQHLEAPDYVAAFSQQVANYRQEQDAVAERLLRRPEPVSNEIRAQLPDTLGPVLKSFAEQAADIEKAAWGDHATITEHGRQEQLAAIAKDKQAAVLAIVSPMKEKLASAERAAREHLGRLTDSATVADRAEATALGYELGVLNGEQGLARIGQVLYSALSDKRVSFLVAVLPILKSLPEKFTASGELAGLISGTESVVAGWQHSVTRGKLARIERMRYEMDAILQDALSPDKDAARMRLAFLEPAIPTPALDLPAPNRLRKLKRVAAKAKNP